MGRRSCARPAGGVGILAPVPPLRALAGALPHGAFRKLVGSGHWLNWEQSAVFDAVVGEFLGRHA